MAQPNPDAVKRLARYMRAKMPALVMHGNPHEALAEWLLSDVLPYGMEIMQTGDIQSIDEREALRSELAVMREAADLNSERATRARIRLNALENELKKLVGRDPYDDDEIDERYGTWHSPTEPS